MKVSYVYILHCADGSYYIGVTKNVFERFDEHQDGHYFDSYTYNRRPVELVYYTEFADIRKAIAFEKQIKKWSRSKKEALIGGKYGELPNLSKKRFK